MIRTTVLTMAAALLLVGPVAAQAPDAEQLASALLAAPEAMRADATVLGWDADGKNVSLREGTGDLVCLSDRPGNDAFSLACYHKDLEPYMARGRELVREGVTGADRNEAHRWQEAKEGKLTMPTAPRMLYVLTGSGFDAMKGEVTDPYARWVLYWPNATAETVGLSAKPSGPGVPWLMNEGTPGAHIMISPPRQRD